MTRKHPQEDREEQHSWWREPEGPEVRTRLKCLKRTERAQCTWQRPVRDELKELERARDTEGPVGMAKSLNINYNVILCDLCFMIILASMKN